VGSDEDAADLRAAAERIVLQFAGYGYRRVTAQLRREGWTANGKRVLRVMREESLLCRLKRRFVVTTDSQHAHCTHPNLLKEAVLTGIDQAWQADITYIRLPRRFCYLASVLDAYSRRCVGWSLGLDIDTGLALSALEMALSQRRPAPGLIHHSDRGVQYACGAYVERLRAAQARVSMSARGTPYDNAKAESFFRTLKQEEVYISDYQDFDEAARSIEHFIGKVYNHKRLHSSLGYVPPAEYERLLTNNDPTININNNKETPSL
jgi:transposase InsO family protein